MNNNKITVEQLEKLMNEHDISLDSFFKRTTEEEFREFCALTSDYLQNLYGLPPDEMNTYIRYYFGVLEWVVDSPYMPRYILDVTHKIFDKLKPKS